jgi:hypothetical protein
MSPRKSYPSHRELNPCLVSYEGGSWDGCADSRPDLPETISVSFKGKADWYRRTERKTMVKELEAEATVYVFECSESERNHR